MIMPDNHRKLVSYQKTRVGAKERLVPEQQQTIWREPALAAEEAAAAESDNGVSTGSSSCIPSVLLIQDLGLLWGYFETILGPRSIDQELLLHTISASDPGFGTFMGIF